MPQDTKNYFAWADNGRHLHLSVGAVIENGKGELLVMHLPNIDTPYFFPAKTHHPDQTLEGTLQLVTKEIGWELEILEYLGSTTAKFPVPNDPMQVAKTTLWFKCKPVSQIERDKEDRDFPAEVRWETAKRLSVISAEQSGVAEIGDLRPVINLLQQ